MLVVVALFWRIFFFGETLIDVDTLDNQLPWGYTAGLSSDYPYNRRDITNTYVTRDYFVVDAYRDGEAPLWNPYSFSGHPIYADGVTRALSPFLLLYTFLDVPLGYSVARVTELLLAGIFMYVFLASIGTGAPGALFGSLAFILSTHAMLHLTGLGWWGGLMWLPLILLCADRAVNRGSLGWALAGGVVLGVQFFCAYLPNQIYYLAVIPAYFLFLGLRPGLRSTLGNGVRAAALAVVTIAVGLGLGATQWAPVLELLGLSHRGAAAADVGYIYLPPWYLATLIFPNLFGRAYDADLIRLFTPLHVSHDHILYIGIAALFAVAVALHGIWTRSRARTEDGFGEIADEVSSDLLKSRRTLFFAGLAVVSLAVMMTAPLYQGISRFVPVIGTIRVTVRIGTLLVFALSALAAVGTGALMGCERSALRLFANSARRTLAWMAGGLMVASILSFGLVWAGVLYPQARPYLPGSGLIAYARDAGSGLAVQFRPPTLDLILPLIFLAALAALLEWRARARISPPALFAGLVVLLVTDLACSGAQFNRTFDRSRVFPPTRVTDLIRSLPPGRVLVTPADLDSNRRSNPGGEKIIAPPNTLLPYRIATVTGKDQLYPDSYHDYASLIESQPLSHVVFNQAVSRYFDLLNVRYVLTHASAPPVPEHRLIATAEGVSLYENPRFLPRAFLVGTVVSAKNPAEALDALADPGFDPAREAVVEGVEASHHDVGRGSVDFLEDHRNRVVLRTEADNEALLVLSDNYYPGWRGTVDGAPTTILRANATMRAIRLTAGVHQVEFEFRPRVYELSAFVSLIVAGAVVAFFLTGGATRIARGAR